MQTAFTHSIIPTEHAESNKIKRNDQGKKLSLKRFDFFLYMHRRNKKRKNKFTLFTKYKNFSSHVLKISVMSLVLGTREIADIFNTFDEYTLYSPQKVNYLRFADSI